MVWSGNKPWRNVSIIHVTPEMFIACAQTGSELPVTPCLGPSPFDLPHNAESLRRLFLTQFREIAQARGYVEVHTPVGQLLLRRVPHVDLG